METVITVPEIVLYVGNQILVIMDDFQPVLEGFGASQKKTAWIRFTLKILQAGWELIYLKCADCWKSWGTGNLLKTWRKWNLNQFCKSSQLSPLWQIFQRQKARYNTHCNQVGPVCLPASHIYIIKQSQSLRLPVIKSLNSRLCLLGIRDHPDIQSVVVIYTSE